MADAPTPDASDTPSGFTLDLSTGKAPSRRKRKGPAAVVQQTINLSTPKADPPPAPQASTPRAPSGKRTRPTGSSTPRRAPRSGNSLADLLDPDTLARLRGED